MMPVSLRTPRGTTRRAFLTLMGAGVLAAPAIGQPTRRQRSSMWLAYTSFAVRLRQGRDLLHGNASALDAAAFRELCVTFEASGGQIDFSQLPAGAGPLAAVRDAFTRDGLALEVSMPSRALETPEAYAAAVATARALGATRARVALLSGRRYESFETPASWAAFASTWRETLLRMRPEFERQQFALGIENHKDWLAPELAALLRAIDSRYVGACVDFGNNIALLEDPDETIEVLAPLAVTTHLKDMAVRRTTDGFELSEVPLGQGILPLARYIETIRRARPEARFCLEMMTRDPLRVPYLTDRYWVPFDAAARRPERVRAFETRVLSQARHQLPRISHLPAPAQLKAEDGNVRACVSHARGVLKLETDRA
jgi:sugar phosphate isomerase/epimerase